MRPLKLALISAAAALSIAALGSASASATTLCSTNTSPCTGKIYEAGEALSGQLKAATVFTNNFSNVTCQKSTFSGETTSKGGTGKPVTASIKSVTFSMTECKTAGGNECTVTATNTPWAASFSANGGGNGSLLLSSSGIGNPAIHLNCAKGLVFECTLKATSITLSVTGGSPAIAAGKNLPMEEEGPNCAGENKWDVEYEITAPKPLFVVF